MNNTTDCHCPPYMYLQDSVLKCFEQSAGELTTCNGVAEIRTFFEGLFGLLSDLSTLDAPVVEVTESPNKQVAHSPPHPLSSYLCHAYHDAGLTGARLTCFTPRRLSL